MNKTSIGIKIDFRIIFIRIDIVRLVSNDDILSIKDSDELNLVDNICLENGHYFLMEDNQYIILEAA